MKTNLAPLPDGMPSVKVSVLVPVYNGEKFLPECLDSILAQEDVGMEILLADDGSTDGSMAVLETYAARDPRIRWWKNRAWRETGTACCKKPEGNMSNSFFRMTNCFPRPHWFRWPG